MFVRLPPFISSLVDESVLVVPSFVLTIQQYIRQSQQKS